MNKKAQATIEFTFAIITVMLIAYGLVMVLRWAGLSFVERRYTQEKTMTMGDVDEHGHTPEEQVNNNKSGYRTRHLEAVYPGGLYAK